MKEGRRSLEEITWKIYKLTNNINGKVYIGQTRQNLPEDRWKKGNGYRYNEKLYKDILEFGWENFNKEIIEEVEDENEARDEELKYILLYDAVNKGYNNSYNTNNTRKKGKGVFVFDENKKLVDHFSDYIKCAERFGISKCSVWNSILNHQNIYDFTDSNKIYYVCWDNEDYKNINFKLVTKGRKLNRKLKVLNKDLETIHTFNTPLECAEFYNISSRGAVTYAMDNRTPLKNHNDELLFVCYDYEDPTKIEFKTKQKRIETIREKYAKKLYCIQLDKTYFIKDFAKEQGVSYEYVSAVLRHRKGYTNVKGLYICYEYEKDTFDINTILNRENQLKRKVICNETGEVFDSVAKCASRFNTFSSIISAICQHKKGCKTLQHLYTFDYVDSSLTPNPIKNRGKKIKCIQTNKIFNTVTEASKYYNIDITQLSQVLNKYQKTVKGLSFEYSEN